MILKFINPGYNLSDMQLLYTSSSSGANDYYSALSEIFGKIYYPSQEDIIFDFFNISF